MGQELIERKWLREEIVGAGIETVTLSATSWRAGYIRMGPANPLARIRRRSRFVHTRQVDVENDQVGNIACEFCETLLSTFDAGDAVSLHLQDDDQDSWTP